MRWLTHVAEEVAINREVGTSGVFQKGRKRAVPVEYSSPPSRMTGVDWGRRKQVMKGHTIQNLLSLLANPNLGFSFSQNWHGSHLGRGRIQNTKSQPKKTPSPK
ncbi:UNVERIFIED_CONTAM: hypothetical protein K2H54_053004 [Gekko kuhli]